MVEFFANSLIDGLKNSSAMGQGIVGIQMTLSVLMVWWIVGKYRQLKHMMTMTKRLSHDIMGGRDVLEYYVARHDSQHTSVENIYVATCERMLKLFAPDVRMMLVGRQATSAALSKYEMGLVRSLCEHTLDEEEIRVESGMGLISTIVGVAPMLGLLGTVWGVLDAFAEMGAAGSATIATMAPAISSALVTTVVGLLIAIPGIFGHMWLSSQVQTVDSDLEGFVDDLMGRIEYEFCGGEA
ncbi:MAG: MotA/TolQ/ExbB proton channel family protein [Kiritimatiellia bacterium]